MTEERIGAARMRIRVEHASTVKQKTTGKECGAVPYVELHDYEEPAQGADKSEYVSNASSRTRLNGGSSMMSAMR
jgi:hypothetical protein